MDLEFFKELTALQWVMIAIGIVIIFPYVKGIFVTEIPEFTPEPSVDVEDSAITCLVERWDSLYQCCENLEMEDVCSKLDEVFPMFVNAPKGCCKTKKEEIPVSSGDGCCRGRELYFDQQQYEWPDNE